MTQTLVEWARSAPALYWLAGGTLALLFFLPLYRATRRRSETKEQSFVDLGDGAGEASTSWGGERGETSASGTTRSGMYGKETAGSGVDGNLKRNLRDRVRDRLNRKYRAQPDSDASDQSSRKQRKASRSFYEEGQWYEETRRWRPSEEGRRAWGVPDDVAWAHSVLGTTPDFTPEEIKKAYLNGMKSHHPDRAGNGGGNGDAEASEKAKLINMAYDILKTRT